MSLFSAKVTVKDFVDMKSGMAADKVAAGDYEVTAVGMKEIEPSEKLKGCGAFIVSFCINDTNTDEETHGKTIEEWFRYHPNPPDDGKQQMNDITLQNMAKLIDACQFEPTTGPDGKVDILENLTTVLATEPTLWLTVERDKEKGYQNLGSFRAATS